MPYKFYIAEIKLPGDNSSQYTIALSRIKEHVQTKLDAYVQFMNAHGINTTKWQPSVHIYSHRDEA